MIDSSFFYFALSILLLGLSLFLKSFKVQIYEHESKISENITTSCKDTNKG